MLNHLNGFSANTFSVQQYNCAAMYKIAFALRINFDLFLPRNDLYIGFILQSLAIYNMSLVILVRSGVFLHYFFFLYWSYVRGCAM